MKFAKKAQRLAEAKRKIKSINELLVKGYHIGQPVDQQKEKPKKENWTVLEAIEWVRVRKEPSIRKGSVQSFQLLSSELERWLKLKGMANLPLFMLKPDHLDQYLVWVRKERNIGNTTYNNYLEFTRMMPRTVSDRTFTYAPAPKTWEPGVAYLFNTVSEFNMRLLKEMVK